MFKCQSSSQDSFQKLCVKVFEDIEGVTVIVDDLLNWGENAKQHDSQVLDRAMQRNLKQKCQIQKDEINYIGHILSKDG